MTLNAPKATTSFALTLVMISYMPVSGNRYFTENCPSGTVILLNLKLLNVHCCYVSLKYLLRSFSNNLLSLDSVQET